MKKINKFDSMIGTLQEYHGQQYIIRDIVDMGDDRFDVITNRKVIKETLAGMREFVLLQTKEELANSNALVLSVGSKDNNLNKAADAVLDAIEKLKNGECTPKDIERARAINESAQVITNMAKVQLEVIRAARDLGR